MSYPTQSSFTQTRSILGKRMAINERELVKNDKYLTSRGDGSNNFCDSVPNTSGGGLDILRQGAQNMLGLIQGIAGPAGLHLPVFDETEIQQMIADGVITQPTTLINETAGTVELVLPDGTRHIIAFLNGQPQQTSADGGPTYELLNDSVPVGAHPRDYPLSIFAPKGSLAKIQLASPAIPPVDSATFLLAFFDNVAARNAALAGGLPFDSSVAGLSFSFPPDPTDTVTIAGDEDLQFTVSGVVPIDPTNQTIYAILYLTATTVSVGSIEITFRIYPQI